MKIGDVSRELGIPASTIRYYERVGVIKSPTRISGVREFDANAVLQLRVVLLAKASGFSVAEMKSLLEKHSEGSAISEAWSVLAKNRQLAVRMKISELQQIDQNLSKLMKCNCTSLQQCVGDSNKVL